MTPTRPLLLDDEEGVSPVIGMILVLAISVAGIAAILYWGLPAIDEMKANVEARSVQSQFVELDSTVKELVAGTTEKTAKRWQPSINRGDVSVRNNTEPWLYATEPYSGSTDVGIFYGGLSDGDQVFYLQHNNTIAGVAAALTSVKVEAYIVTGTSSQTTLAVSVVSTTKTQMTGTDLASWNANTDKAFYVWTSSQTAQRLENATFHFKVYSGSTLVGEAWYMATGRIDFNLNAGLGTRAVIENNGAILTGVNGNFAMLNSPPIPPQTSTGGVHRFFGRSVVMGGNVSIGGSNQFDLLVTLYSTATLASYDCALSTHTDCAESARIFDYGTYQAPWYSYLSSTDRGYTFTQASKTINGQTVTYLDDRQPYMGFTLLESNIQLST